MLYVNFSVKCLKALFSAYFGSHFCYHSNGKNRINPRLLHLGYCSNKLIRRNSWKAIFIFWPHRGGQLASLCTYPFTILVAFIYLNYTCTHSCIYLIWDQWRLSWAVWPVYHCLNTKYCRRSGADPEFLERGLIYIKECVIDGGGLLGWFYPFFFKYPMKMK